MKRPIMILSAATALSLGLVAPAAADILDRDCSDFATQQEAQAVFEQHSEDVFDLDLDGDGLACESLPSGGGDGDTDGDDTNGNDTGSNGTGDGTSQTTTVPQGGVDTGDGSLADRGNQPWTIAALTVIVVGVLTAGGVRLARR